MSRNKKPDIKVRFIRNHSPRKKGEVATLEARLAEYYISIQTAEIVKDCDECTDEHPCEECGGETKKEKKGPMSSGNSFTSEDQPEFQDTDQVVLEITAKKYDGKKKGDTIETTGEQAKALIAKGIVKFLSIKS